MAGAETARNLQGNASVAGNAAPLLSSRRKRLSRGSQPVIALRAPDVSLIQLGRCQPCLPFVDRVKAQPKTGAAAPASRGVSASRGHEIADPSRSRTVLETRISPVPARAETRAAVCMAIPPRVGQASDHGLGPALIHRADVLLTRGCNGARACCPSKIAQIMFTTDLADELAGTHLHEHDDGQARGRDADQQRRTGRRGDPHPRCVAGPRRA